MPEIVNVPEDQYRHFFKYVEPALRFADAALLKEGNNNLKFLDLVVVPKNGITDFSFESKGEPYHSRWAMYQGVCVDCPPSERQLSAVSDFMFDKVLAEDWNQNKEELYEQLVGDECYEGINA